MRLSKNTALARLTQPSLVAALLALATSCGPGVIGVGAAELADDNNQQLVLLVFVNEGLAPVQLDVSGVTSNGDALNTDTITVAAGGRVTLPIDDPDQLRVRAHEALESTARPPATWDFALEAPEGETECAFQLESVVIAGLEPTTTETSAIELQALRGTGTLPEFQRLARLGLVETPRLVRTHPAGGYVYTVTDLDEDTLELRAFRSDSATGAIEFIQPARVGLAGAATTQNPQILSRNGSRGDVEFSIDPRSRFAYLLDTDAGLSQTLLTVYPIAVDGSLGIPAFSQLGRIVDLAFRPDGQFVYWIETGDGGAMFQVRSARIRDDGTFELVSTAPLPCVADQGDAMIRVHPSGRLAYIAVRDEGAGLVRLGSYFTDPFGGLARVALSGTRCSDVTTIEDFDFDPAGSFLYLTGSAPDPFPSGPTATRMIRYRIDASSGQFGDIDTEQDFGPLITNLTRTRDPSRSAIDPLREIVYVAIEDRLVPHVRTADGSLQALPTGVSLPFGSPDSTSLVQGVTRGCVQITTRP